MNILNVNMSQHPKLGGGAAERTLKMTLALNEIEGVYSRILTTDYGIENQQVHSLLRDSIILHCWNKRWYIPAPQFIKIYKAVAWADIVHFMNHWTMLNALVYFVVKIINKPYVICPAGSLPIFGRSSIIKRIYSMLVGNSILKHAKSLIAITDDEVNLFRKLGIKKEKIALIKNGVWERDFTYGSDKLFRELIKLNDHPYILFLGRLNSIKGPDILLNSFIRIAGKYPSHHLVFVGPDGGMEEHLKSRIKQNNLSNRVHISGFAAGDIKSSAYHGAELVVIPSRQEAMSIVALEAGLCGTPVLLTDQCGFPELEKNGGGSITSADDIEMAKSIDELLGDPLRLKRMGSVAQNYVLENYDWKVCAQKTLSKYKLILGTGNDTGE